MEQENKSLDEMKDQFEEFCEYQKIERLSSIKMYRVERKHGDVEDILVLCILSLVSNLTPAEIYRNQHCR